MTDLTHPRSLEMKRIDSSLTSALILIEHMKRSSSYIESATDSEYGIALAYDKYSGYGITLTQDSDSPVFWIEYITIPYDQLTERKIESIIATAGYPEYDSWFSLLWDIVSYGYYDRMQPASMSDTRQYVYTVFDRDWYDTDSWKRFIKEGKCAYSPTMTKKLYKDHAGNLESFLIAELESTM